MFKFTMIAAMAALTAGVANAAPTMIDFDAGTDSTAIGGFYTPQGVTFSNAEFAANFSLAGSSGTLGVRAPGTYKFGPSNAVVASFTSPVTSVTVRGIDVGAAGIRLTAYNAANVILGSSTAFGSGVGVGAFFDVTTSYGGIAKVAFSQDNPCCGDGMVFDNLSFTAGVPDAPAWALLIVGFGLTGTAVRARRAVAA